MGHSAVCGVWNRRLEIEDIGQNKTENKRLAELMKNFGCGDEIAPLDAAFGRRMGAIIAQAVSAPRPRLAK
jgi:hypothetical protein